MSSHNVRVYRITINSLGVILSMEDIFWILSLCLISLVKVNPFYFNHILIPTLKSNHTLHITK